MSTVRVYEAKAEIQRTGTATAPATVRIYEAAAQITSGPPPGPVGVATVRIYEATATISTGAPPTPNPAKLRIYDVKVKVTPGGPAPARTGAWAPASSRLVPARVYARSEVH